VDSCEDFFLLREGPLGQCSWSWAVRFFLIGGVQGFLPKKKKILILYASKAEWSGNVGGKIGGRAGDDAQATVFSAKRSKSNHSRSRKVRGVGKVRGV